MREVIGRFLEVSAKLEVFSKESVEAAIGCTFHKSAGSNSAFTVYQAQTWPPFSTMEIRAPTDQARRAGMLIADLSERLSPEDLAPFVAPYDFLGAIDNPLPFDFVPEIHDLGASESPAPDSEPKPKFVPTGASWYKLGPHKLAVGEEYPGPTLGTLVTSLAVHGFDG